MTVRNLCLCHPLCGGEELELKHEAETQIQAHLRVQLVFWKQSREKKQEQKNDGSGLRTVTLNNPSFSKKRTSSSTDCLSGTDKNTKEQSFLIHSGCKYSDGFSQLAGIKTFPPV